jgi:hypothetical protein
VKVPHVKPKPAVPRTPVIMAKPHHRGAAKTAAPAGGWSVTLSVDNANNWATWYTALTAIANGDVGPTPYYTQLYDATTGTFLGTCDTGTDCQVTVSQSAATTHRYMAYVTSSIAHTFPPADQLPEAAAAAAGQGSCPT